MEKGNNQRNELISFLGFISNNIGVIGMSICVTLISYGYKLFSTSYSIDSEIFINSANSFRQGWTALGRYFLFFMSRFFRFSIDLNPSFLNILTYMLLIISNLLLLYLFYINGLKSKSAMYVFSGLYLSSPVIIEQTNFILQSAEVVFAECLIILSLILLSAVDLLRTNRIIVYSAAIVLNVISFATYSSLFVLFIILSIIIAELRIRNITNKISLRKYFKLVLPFVGIFLISYFFNFVAVFISKKIVGIDNSSDYLNSQFALKNMSIREYSSLIAHNFSESFLNLHNQYFLWLLLLGAIMLIMVKIFTHSKNTFYYFANMVLIFIFSLTSFWVVGKATPIRALFPAVPIAMAFFWAYLVSNINFAILKRIVIASMFIMVLAQTKVTSDFCYSSELIFRDDVSRTENIVSMLQNKGIKHIDKYDLAVIGNYQEHDPQVIKGNSIGYSFYEWDYGTPVNSSYRTSGFWRSLGYKVGSISESSYNDVVRHNNKYRIQLPVYIYGKHIVVNLENLTY